LAHRVAIHVAEHEIEDHAVGTLVARQARALLALVGGDDLEALELERVAQAPHDVGLVLDDEDLLADEAQARSASSVTRSACASASGARSGAMGSAMVNVLPIPWPWPGPGSLTTVTWPPCASVICLTI